MKKNNLGRRVAIFMYDYDTYGCWDAYGTLNETITGVCDEISDPEYRKGLLEGLLDIANNEEEFKYRIEAARLYREVKEYES